MIIIKLISVTYLIFKFSKPNIKFFMVKFFSKSKFYFWNSHFLHLTWQIFQTIDFWPTFPKSLPIWYQHVDLHHSFWPFDPQFYERLYVLRIWRVLKNPGITIFMKFPFLWKYSSHYDLDGSRLQTKKNGRDVDAGTYKLLEIFGLPFEKSRIQK